MMSLKRLLMCLLVVSMVLGLESFGASAANPPIKIGFMSALTGALAGAGGELRDGFLLYLEEIGGKIGDREIRVIVEDDEGNPGVGLTKFRKLVEKDKVNL